MREIRLGRSNTAGHFGALASDRSAARNACPSSREDVKITKGPWQCGIVELDANPRSPT